MFVQSARFTEHDGGLSFYGQERIETTWRLCKMNLILHGLDGQITIGNSLLGDTHPGLKADVVIANPPFNQRSWGADKVDEHDARLQIGYGRGQPTDSSANTMLMMHFLQHLADGGAAGYVMANGSMTTNTREEKATRQALVDEGFVDCIVQLPDKLFFGTGIPLLSVVSQQEPRRHPPLPLPLRRDPLCRCAANGRDGQPPPARADRRGDWPHREHLPPLQTP